MRATFIVFWLAGAMLTAQTRPIVEFQRAADAYALELAKLWVDSHMRGGNGRGRDPSKQNVLNSFGFEISPRQA